MQLGDHNAFGSVDDESTARRHIRDHAEIHVLHDGLKIFVFLVVAGKLQLSLEGNAISESTFDALLDAVTGSVDVVVKKFESKIASCVGDGEVFGENLVKAFVFPVVRIGLQLEEILERLKLNIQKIRIFERLLDGREAYSFS